MLNRMLEPASPEGPNAEQIRYWNGLMGETWVTLEPKVSAQLRPFGEQALAAAALEPGHRVLDVGCGGGDTTIAAARRVGPGGSVTGVDICEAMLSLAERNVGLAGLSNVSFLLADAQTAELPEAAFDVVISRFGVMFFADPGAAFRNLRRALVPGGRLAFACWRAPLENAWMMIPAAAVAAHLTISPPEPHAPGPCALADAERTRSILEAAGFVDVQITASERVMRLGGSRTIDEATDFLLQVGPVARALRDADPEKVPLVRDALREALAPHADGSGVALGGAIWLVTARAAA